jgi:hypothetical protein
MKLKSVSFTVHSVLRHKFVFSVIIACFILLFSAYLRLSIVSGSLPYVGHVDEPKILNNASKILKTGDWNPHFFNYPSFPIYLTAAGLTIGYLNAASHLEIKNTKDIGSLSYPYFTHPRIVWPAKACFVLLSIVSMGFLAIIAYKFFVLPPIVLWLIPAILTLSQQYHFSSQQYINVDILACFWIISVYLVYALSIEKDTLFHKAFLPGLLSGFAIASKYTMFPILVPSLLIIMAYSKEKLWKVSLLIFTMILTFFMLVPYSLLDFPTFLNHVSYEVFHYSFGHRGHEGTPGFSQIVYYVKQLLKDFGWGSSVFVVFGLIISLKNDWRKSIIFMSFPVIFLLYMSCQKVHFVRNILSLYAFYALFAAIGAIGIYKCLVSLIPHILRTRFSPFRISSIALFIVVTGMVISFPVSRPFFWMPVTPDTRKVAVEWITLNVPQRSTVIVPKEFYFDWRSLKKTYKVIQIPFKDFTQETFYEELKNHDTPYVIMPNWVYDLRKPSGKELAERLNQLSSLLEELQRFSGREKILENKSNISGNGVIVNYPRSVKKRDPEFFIGRFKK